MDMGYLKYCKKCNQYICTKNNIHKCFLECKKCGYSHKNKYKKYTDHLCFIFRKYNMNGTLYL